MTSFNNKGEIGMEVKMEENFPWIRHVKMRAKVSFFFLKMTPKPIIDFINVVTFKKIHDP